MKKISKDIIASAWDKLRSESSNKFWGLISILRSVPTESVVVHGITYRLNTILLSETLERLFYYGDDKKAFNDNSNFVTFSSVWAEKFSSNFNSSKVSLGDAAIFFNVDNEFEHEVDLKALVDNFVKEIHLSEEDIDIIFDTQYQNINIVLEDDYPKSELFRLIDAKYKLNLNSAHKTLTIESPYTVNSRPSNTSQAPFIQTLYAGRQVAECLLLTQFDFKQLYTNIAKKELPVTILLEGKQKIYFGAPGTGKSHTIKNEDLKGVADDCIFRTTFHPDSDYSSFVGCYKPISHNSRILRVDYTIDDLASMLHQNYADAPNKVTALHSFVLEYADYFNGKIAAFNKKDLIAKSGLSATYEVEVGKIVNLNQWMVDNGYMSTPSTISYEFSPEVFTNAYVEAWNNPTKPIYLIIEEINRGNCAQVFGDIFQLLDREDGVSEYAIKADAALCQYLQRSLRGEGLEGIKDGKLKLPSNLSILATMNTSDQSLFPMDSAFKRRWEWEFIPINSSEVSYAKIIVDDKEYSWSTFIEKVNEKIMNTCKSEDKQLGAFFIKVSKEKPDIDWKLFRSKVMSFLWFDVYKDLYESDENTVFRYYKDDKQEESVEFSFGKLFDGEEKMQIKLLQDFMEYINKE